MDRMLKAALYYHSEGLCVIPVASRNKMPALSTWEAYQTQCSTKDEVLNWFDNGQRYNVGIVHGAVSGNYITLDIDHDSGIFETLQGQFPDLCAGRLEQSGSGEGYHIPLIVTELPDFGTRNNGQAKGNQTWKTEQGDVNIRAQFCQTVAPPSVHPCGNQYKFLRWGDIVSTASVTPLIEWLDTQTVAPVTAPPPQRQRRTTAHGNSLLEAVKAAWPTALTVFQHWGRANAVKQERNGELRLSDNGGLLISGEDPTIWYCFSDEAGGSVIEAWGWCRFGSAYNPSAHFRQVLVEMGQAAGLDVAAHYRRGDEQVMARPQPAGYWMERYSERFERLRT